MVFLGESRAFVFPTCCCRRLQHNHGNYIVSLGSVTKLAGRTGRSLGVEIFPGFAAAEVLYNEDGSVKGVATGNMGVGKDGEPRRELPDRHGAAG
jgi:electron-transferring-flavoprotein dehydrogenase